MPEQPTAFGEGRADKLSRHDRTIVVNELRWAFSSWTDRLIALIVVVVAVAGSRSALSAQPWRVAAAIVAMLAAAVGVGAARIVRRRLDFHAHDGIIAADALSRRSRRRYATAFHATALCLIIGLALMARPGIVVAAVVGYLAGAGVGHVANRSVGWRGSGRSAFARRVAALLQRPVAGVAAAVPFVALLVLGRSIETGRLAALAGGISAITVLSLTTVDDAVVRFMTWSGFRAVTIIARRARAALIYLLLLVPAGLTVSVGLALVVLVVVLAALALMATRILVYRIHAKRAADMIVSICAAVVGFAGVMAPMIAPLVVITIFVHLGRRSAPATWMLE